MSRLPSHYFPILTNQLAVLLTECWTTNYTSLGISITIEDDTKVNMPYCLMEQILFFSPWIQLLPSLRYEWITVRWVYQSGLSPHRYEQTALGKTVAIFNDLITPALTNSNPPFHSIHPNQSVCPESLLQVKKLLPRFTTKSQWDKWIAIVRCLL